MSADEIIYKALSELKEQTKIPFAEERFNGQAEKYIVWNEADTAEYSHADNVPLYDKTFIQIHYFCPLHSEDDSRTVTTKIKKIFRKYDFCFSGTRRTTADRKRHVIIECNILTKSKEREE